LFFIKTVLRKPFKIFIDRSFFIVEGVDVQRGKNVLVDFAQSEETVENSSRHFIGKSL
jgi:hypothetical protein